MRKVAELTGVPKLVQSTVGKENCPEGKGLPQLQKKLFCASARYAIDDSGSNLMVRIVCMLGIVFFIYRIFFFFLLYFVTQVVYIRIGIEFVLIVRMMLMILMC